MHESVTGYTGFFSVVSHVLAHVISQDTSSVWYWLSAVERKFLRLPGKHWSTTLLCFSCSTSSAFPVYMRELPFYKYQQPRDHSNKHENLQQWEERTSRENVKVLFLLFRMLRDIFLLQFLVFLKNLHGKYLSTVPMGQSEHQPQQVK